MFHKASCITLNGLLSASLLLVFTFAEAATYTVTTTSDVGASNCTIAGNRCILRDAINTANANAGLDTIRFSFAGSIVPVSMLPNLTSPVIIDGTTAPGYIAGGPPVVSIDGVLAGASANGLRFANGSAVSDVTAISIVGFDANGISTIQNADSILVQSSYIGVRPDGSAAANGTGISLGTDFNIIGNTDRPNLIAANTGVGVSIAGDSNDVRFNHIGRQLVPSIPGNGSHGVNVAGNNNTIGFARIGGSDAINTIVGNGGDGVFVFGNDNTILGNDIGGSGSLGNTGDGVAVFGSRNTVGGDTASHFNVVRNNLVGIRLGETLNASDTIVANNSVSESDQTGIQVSAGSQNSIRNNRVYGNGTVGGFSGIWLQSDSNFVYGNEVGVQLAPTPGNSGNGIHVSGDRNVIGLDSTGQVIPNIIGQNGGSGILLTGDHAIIQGNYIGTDESDTILGNDLDGIAIIGTVQGSPGDLMLIRDNVIGHNGQDGIYTLSGAQLRQALVCGNFIGISPMDANIGNAQDGIDISANNVFIEALGDCLSNVIGNNGGEGINLQGTTNVVSFNHIGRNRSGSVAAGNQVNGIRFTGSGTGGNTVQGNFIAFNQLSGISADGNTGTGNLLFQNFFHDNSSIGIDLGGDGVTTNDALDADTGPNQYQNYPVLGNVMVENGLLSLDILIDSDPMHADYPITIDLYLADAIGSRQGRTLLDTITITEPFAGTPVSASGILLDGVTVGSLVATATADRETSEFSQPLTFGLPDELFENGFECPPGRGLPNRGGC